MNKKTIEKNQLSKEFKTLTKNDIDRVFKIYPLSSDMRYKYLSYIQETREVKREVVF